MICYAIDHYTESPDGSPNPDYSHETREAAILHARNQYFELLGRHVVVVKADDGNTVVRDPKETRIQPSSYTPKEIVWLARIYETERWVEGEPEDD